MKIIIYPISYGPGCGGPICLHKLCHDLNTLGYESYFPHPNLTVNKALKDVQPGRLTLNPKWNTPVTDSIDLENDVIVYPEGIVGNPLGFKNIVRWILYYPTLDIKNSYNKTDLLFYYSKDFYNKTLDSKNKLVTNSSLDDPNILYTIDTKKDYYRDIGLSRLQDAVLIYKAKNKEDIFIDPKHSSLSQVIPYQNEEFYLKFFNTVNTLYCYDTASYYSVIAALCGCKVIVIPEENLSKEEFKSNILGQKYGIAYGEDDVKVISKEAEKIRPHLKEIEDKALESVKEFAVTLFERFG